MTSSDFVRTYLGLYTNPDYNPDSVNLLAGIVDTSKDGFVSNIFSFSLMSMKNNCTGEYFFSSDSYHLPSFKRSKDCSVYQMLCIRQLSSCLILMEMEWLHLVCGDFIFFFKSIRHKDTISYSHFSDEFAEVMRKTELHRRMPFNMDSSFIKLYFGKDKQRLISYAEFSQFLHVSFSNKRNFLFLERVRISFIFIFFRISTKNTRQKRSRNSTRMAKVSFRH